MPGWGKASQTWKIASLASMDIHGYRWISMDIHGYPWIYMDIHGFHRLSVDIHGYPLIRRYSFIDIHRSWISWISKAIHGYPWISIDIIEINGSPLPPTERGVWYGNGVSLGKVSSIAFVCQFQGWGRLMELVGYTYHQMCVVFRSLVWVKHPMNIIPSLSLNLGLFFFMHIYIQAFWPLIIAVAEYGGKGSTSPRTLSSASACVPKPT